MSGQAEEWKFARQVAEQKEAGWSLREQLIWRVERLTSAQSIDLSEHAEHFPEVIEGFTVPGARPYLVPYDEDGKLVSKASLEDGGSLLLTGGLISEEDELVGLFKRRLQFEPGWAVHEWLRLEPGFRGRGIAPRLLRRSFALYDALELEEVHLVAALETGRWYWAHMGFDFLQKVDRELVCAWGEEVCRMLGIEGIELGESPSAAQIARLDCDRELTLEELARAMPSQRARIEEEISAKNDLPMDRSLSLGRVIMLSGPRWRGFLQLRGPHRIAFEEAVAEREQKASASAAETEGEVKDNELGGPKQED